MLGWLRRLLQAEKGSIAVLGALSLTAVIGMSGIAVELGSGYAAKVRNQRVADMAALGAAVAYNAASQSFTAAQATANDIVLANGLATSTAAVTQATVNGQSAIRVIVTTSVPIRLAGVLTSSPSFNVKNEAYASLTGNATAACITALSTSSTSVSATGGASITAAGCAVNSNGTVASDNSSARITAKQVNANAIADTAAAYNQNAITTNPTANNIVTRANAASDTIGVVTGVKSALCYVNKLTGNSDADYADSNTVCTTQVVTPVVPANTSTTDWNLGYQPRSAGGVYAYQTSDYSCNYVIPAGTYNIRTLSVGGGCSIAFATGSTLTFNQIDMNGSSMSIGDGNLTVSGTFSVNGNNTVTVGNGTHIFGALSIGGGKSLTLGTGNITVGGAISLSGGAFLKANIAAGNTVTIGNDGSGTAIIVGGSSQLCFTSDCSTPTVAAGTFSANGSVTNNQGTIVFPKTATHVINGDLALPGGGIFGSGLYVIKGNFTNGSSGSMQGTAVTFALGGTFNFSGGTTFDLSAPTATDVGYGVNDILFATKSTSGTSISGGSNGKAAGVIYAPKSAFTSSGGSSISSNGSACMMLVVNTVAVSGSGTVNTANCSSQSASSGGTVALLQ